MCTKQSQSIEELESAKVTVFQQRVLAFWRSKGRKDLAWRITKDPWQTVIAEVLLRKTTSRQVVDIFNKLGNLSPEEIACMGDEELETILRPIGMYRVRARQLRLIAEAVAREGGAALESPGFLKNLPGVGRYIENAVLCFAFDERKPALDTNMIRVLQRVFGIKSNRSRVREDPRLWRFAEMLVPEEHCREFNWGILDLATAVCTARKPRCSDCPLREICSFSTEVSSGLK